MNSIHFEMSLGVKVWPSRENKQIATSSRGDNKLYISANTSNQLLIELNDDKEQRVFITQRLSLPLNSLFLLVVKFDFDSLLI